MKQKVIFSVILATLWAAGFSAVRAAEPLAVFSWSADNSAPVWYPGKKIPNINSNISVGFELVGRGASDLGKIVNLKNNEARWYIDDNLITSGTGLQKITLPASSLAGENSSLRISVDFYDADTGSRSFINESFYIPVADPEIVLDFRGFAREVAKNGSVSVGAIPFFFTSNPATLSWKVNDQDVDLTAGADPFQLLVNLGKNIIDSFKIEVSGTRSGESASDSMVFNVL